MATDDREQQFERALARLLRDASPDSQCPDAETLSAYHERTLPLDQMTLWKEHISGCVLCQEILALVEQSENVHTEEWKKTKCLLPNTKKWQQYRCVPPLQNPLRLKAFTDKPCL